MNDIQCFLSCIIQSGLIYPLLSLIGITTICLILFIIKRKYGLLLGSQSFLTVIITLNLFSMQCYMFKWIWIYLSIILIGTLLMSIVKHYISLQLNGNTIQPFSYISELQQKFGIPIKVIDSQKIKAFTFQKRIYLSVGLLERLEKDEIKAVIAHEMYHVNHSPNKFLSSLLALTSLTFHRYNDEYYADRYAAKNAGIHNLINALKKLGIRNCEERARKLSL